MQSSDSTFLDGSLERHGGDGQALAPAAGQTGASSRGGVRRRGGGTQLKRHAQGTGVEDTEKTGTRLHSVSDGTRLSSLDEPLNASAAEKLHQPVESHGNFANQTPVKKAKTAGTGMVLW